MTWERNKKISFFTVLFLIISTLIVGCTISVSGSDNDIVLSLTATFLKEKSTNLTVYVQNNGNTSCHNFEVIPLESDSYLANCSINVSEMKAESALLENITITFYENSLEGRYPLVFLIRYYDENMLLHSILSYHFLTYINDFDSKLDGVLYSIDITNRGKEEMLLKIENLDDKSHDVKVALYLTDEFSTEFVEESVYLDSVDVEYINFDIEALQTITGKSYIILAALEYDYEEYHYTSFVAGTINITGEKEEPYFLWISIVLFFVLLTIYVYYKIKRESTK